MQILSGSSAKYGKLYYNVHQFNPHLRFVDEMMDPLIATAVHYGIDPTVAVAQAGKETGFGNFGRAVLPQFHNTCGLKIYNPALAGDQESPMAHAQFASWDLGARAHCQHLLAYCQVSLPPEDILVDPRWVHVFGKRPAITTVEELGGKWAPSSTYGTEIVSIAKRLSA